MLTNGVTVGRQANVLGRAKDVEVPYSNVMAESLPSDVKTGTGNTVVVPEFTCTEEGEFCSSEAAEIFGQ